MRAGGGGDGGWEEVTAVAGWAGYLAGTKSWLNFFFPGSWLLVPSKIGN
jgi:hypothetical protein